MDARRESQSCAGVVPHVKYRSRTLGRELKLDLNRLGPCRVLVEGKFDYMASKTIQERQNELGQANCPDRWPR